MRIIVFGATGMVGQGVLLEALDDPGVEEVLVVGRSEVELQHDKLQQLLHRDFTSYEGCNEQLRGYDACFFCLGVSSLGMSEDDYRHITYDFTMAAAKALHTLNPDMCFTYVTGVGADSTEKGRTMWARVKGKTENDLLALGFAGGAYMFRPGYIQPVKGVVSGVWWTRLVYALIDWMYPIMNFVASSRVTTTEKVGRAMMRVAKHGGDETVLHAKEINALAELDFTEHAPRKGPKQRRLLRRAFGVLLLLFVLFTVVMLAFSWVAMGKAPAGERLARMEASPQWAGSSFGNREEVWSDVTGMFGEMFSPEPHRTPEVELPVIDTDPALFDTPPESGLRVTWLGHSTAILELDGQTFLTDPVWGERSSPVSWSGPQRWYPPPLAIDQLPEIDAVLISHDHYDHLDHPTVMAMKDVDTTWIVPLGVGAHLEYWGMDPARIVELDWWESATFGDVEVVMTEARHFSGRAIIDYMRTLWAGYALVGPEHRAYYSGDTGYFNGLGDIGEKYGPFDIALVEAGAYGKSWPDVHMGPEQAVRASQVVGSKVYMPVHLGLFNLAYHGWTEPYERGVLAAEAAGMPIAVPQPGESFEPEDIPGLEVNRWWPERPWRRAEEYPVVSTKLEN